MIVQPSQLTTYRGESGWFWIVEIQQAFDVGKQIEIEVDYGYLPNEKSVGTVKKIFGKQSRL